MSSSQHFLPHHQLINPGREKDVSPLYGAEHVGYVPLQYTQFGVFHEICTSAKSRTTRFSAVIAVWPHLSGMQTSNCSKERARARARARAFKYVPHVSLDGYCHCPFHLKFASQFGVIVKTWFPITARVVLFYTLCSISRFKWSGWLQKALEEVLTVDQKEGQEAPWPWRSGSEGALCVDSLSVDSLSFCKCIFAPTLATL